MAQFYSSGTVVPLQVLQNGLKGISGPIAINGSEELTLLSSYTRAGAGGQLVYRVEFSLDLLTWFGTTDIQSVAVVPGTDTTVSQQQATITYQATGATTERFVSPTFTCVGNYFRVLFGDGSVALGSAQIDYFLRGSQT